MARRAAGRVRTSVGAYVCDYKRVSSCPKYHFLQESTWWEKKAQCRSWSRAPVSNKQSNVWCVVNERDWDPEGRKSSARPQIWKTVFLFIIFIAKSSFLNCMHSAQLTPSQTPCQPKRPALSRRSDAVNPQTPTLSCYTKKYLWNSKTQLVLVQVVNLFSLGATLTDRLRVVSSWWLHIMPSSLKLLH